MAGVITNLYERLDDAWRYESDYGNYKDDLQLILELASSSGNSVLEVGAGTGRVAIPLARAGLEVTAVEKSWGMQEIFEQKIAAEDPSVRSRLKIIKGELSTASFDRRFNFAVLAFNFMQLATSRAERLSLLSQLRHALVNRGKLYIEVSMPHPDYTTPGKTGRRYAKTFYDRGRRLWAVLFQSHEYNPASQELTLEFAYLYLRNDGTADRVTRFARLSVLYPVELEGLLDEAGFAVEKLWGGFDKSALSNESQRMIVLAVKP